MSKTSTWVFILIAFIGVGLMWRMQKNEQQVVSSMAPEQTPPVVRPRVSVAPVATIARGAAKTAAAPTPLPQELQHQVEQMMRDEQNDEESPALRALRNKMVTSALAEYSRDVGIDLSALKLDDYELRGTKEIVTLNARDRGTDTSLTIHTAMATTEGAFLNLISGATDSKPDTWKRLSAPSIDGCSFCAIETYQTERGPRVALVGYNLARKTYFMLALDSDKPNDTAGLETYAQKIKLQR